MNLTEAVDSAKYRMLLNKERRTGTALRVVTKYGSAACDDGETVYVGDLLGFKAFVSQMNDLLQKAERFDSLEVPSL